MKNNTQKGPKKLVPGQPVRFIPLDGDIGMKFTRLIALFDKQYPPKLGKRKTWKGTPRKQKRYVIEHLYGFLPSNQPLFWGHPIMEKLDKTRKVTFAYHDELFSLTETEFDELQNVQRTKEPKRT